MLQERVGFLQMLAHAQYVLRANQVPRVKQHVPIVLQIHTAVTLMGDSGSINVISVVETGLDIIVEWGPPHVLIVDLVNTGRVAHVALVLKILTAHNRQLPVQRVALENSVPLWELQQLQHVETVSQVRRVSPAEIVPLVLQILTAVTLMGDSGSINVIPVVEMGLDIIVEWGPTHVLIVDLVNTGRVAHVALVVQVLTAQYRQLPAQTVLWVHQAPLVNQHALHALETHSTQRQGACVRVVLQQLLQTQAHSPQRLPQQLHATVLRGM